MAKNKSGIVKAAVGIGAVVVAGKVAYEKYKTTKSRYTKEEQDSADLEVRKYNAICEKKVVEVEDEEFVGCEIKSVASNTTLDLGLAVFEKDVYINFESVCSNVTIILPEGVNVACDIEKRIAGVHNLVENVDEDNSSNEEIVEETSENDESSEKIVEKISENEESSDKIVEDTKSFDDDTCEEDESSEDIVDDENIHETIVEEDESSENQQIDTVEDDTDEDINQEEAENIETSSEDLPGSESDEESIQDQKEQEKILENVAEVKEIVDKNPRITLWSSQSQDIF